MRSTSFWIVWSEVWMCRMMRRMACTSFLVMFKFMVRPYTLDGVAQPSRGSGLLVARSPALPDSGGLSDQIVVILHSFLDDNIKLLHGFPALQLVNPGEGDFDGVAGFGSQLSHLVFELHLAGG